MPLTCRHVRQLHDGYVDGELSPSMNAEVHAHLLQCPECQRQVELVRTCGDVIAQDRSEPDLDAGFASRVLAAMPPVGERAVSLTLVGTGRIIETRRGRRRRMARAWIRSAVPVAAAVAFFCLAVWPPMRTAGRRRIIAGDSSPIRWLGKICQVQIKRIRYALLTRKANYGTRPSKRSNGLASRPKTFYASSVKRLRRLQTEPNAVITVRLAKPRWGRG